jgi:hypothetical protein
VGSAVGDGDAVGVAPSLAEADEDGDGDPVGVPFRSGVVVVVGEVARVGSDVVGAGAVGWVVVLPVVADVSGGLNQA